MTSSSMTVRSAPLISVGWLLPNSPREALVTAVQSTGLSMWRAEGRVLRAPGLPRESPPAKPLLVEPCALRKDQGA